MSIFKNIIKCIAMAAALTTTFVQAKDAAPLKVGFVYVSPVGEAGWTYTHDVARKYLEEKFGDKIKTTFVESVAEGADAERVITQLAKSGNDLIFSTSFGYMNPTIKVAKRFPNVKFEHATGYKRAKNVGTYFDRIYEARYLTGVLAGYMTKSETIGYVAAFPIPEVMRGINAFTLGLRSVKPNATVKVVWVNSWYDPGKEHEAASSLIQQGADVITQHTDSPAPVQAAEAAGIYAIGYHSDMSIYGPKAFLTSPVHHWNEFYAKRVEQVLNGTWNSEDVWQGIGSGMTTLAPLNPAIPADVVKKINALSDDIASGKLHPFAGPIKGQAGSVIAKEGEIIADKVLLGMNFYVEGVEGKLPN
ncbi:BMP family ABC transporter substrate-binding protein [Psychromonas antarctica]|jgi:basic membrane protein A|uniref:BMP family ABC transporter substrate-binding protein n=1 Tax=Psychromonas antarctica TaxID=67573 RepID=UPI001EE9841B|nr:BMP family ABC transporter substrate-binding protein [Psychromonas antarctica]MCG6202406.1 BMP family ABC transporter substrate-binding protein [Psychromonas antarctica]